ncbi:MAG: aminomethyl transferase family protein, partial [Caulobacteraceae bacterium]
MTLNPTDNLEAAIQRAGNAVELLRNMPGRAYSHGVVDAQFTNWQSEVRAWRESVAFLDQSHHMIDFYVEGPDAFALLASLGINSFKNFTPGMAKQYVVASPDGLYIGDCVLFYLEENLFNLVGRRTVLD